MKKVSNSEYEILKLFFERNNKIASNEIYDLIEQLFKTEWGRQSGSVYLDRMMKKGVIYRERINGRNYYISVAKEEYDNLITDGFLTKNIKEQIKNLFRSQPEDIELCLQEIDEVIKKYYKG